MNLRTLPLQAIFAASLALGVPALLAPAPASAQEAPSGRLLDFCKSFLNSKKVDFKQLDGRTALKAPILESGRGWTFFVQTREAQEQIVMYSTFPMAVPEAHRAAAMEFITRANYGLILGNFEMDLSDGEVRYKTSIDVEKVNLTQELLNPLLYANIGTFRRYFDGLEAVAKGEKSPAAAIAEIEG